MSERWVGSTTAQQNALLKVLQNTEDKMLMKRLIEANDGEAVLVEENFWRNGIGLPEKPKEATMEIIAGKCYRTRGGWKARVKDDISPYRGYPIAFTRAIAAQLFGWQKGQCTS